MSVFSFRDSCNLVHAISHCRFIWRLFEISKISTEPSQLVSSVPALCSFGVELILLF